MVTENDKTMMTVQAALRTPKEYPKEKLQPLKKTRVRMKQKTSSPRYRAMLFPGISPG
jgi:hypothetical protein